MGCPCRHWNLSLAGAALLWGLALGSPAAWAQQTAAPAVNASEAGADKEQCAQGQGGDQSTAPKSGSEGQSDEKSKTEATPPAYKLLRYEEDYSYLKNPSRRTDFWDPFKYVPPVGP